MTGPVLVKRATAVFGAKGTEHGEFCPESSTVSMCPCHINVLCHVNALFPKPSHSATVPPEVMAVIRISIVEDDDQAREALAVLFNGTPGFRCVSTHRSAEDALKKLPVEKCDVVLLDLGLPPKKTGEEGIECARSLKRLRPELLLLVLTVHEDNAKIFESLKAGASGYLLKKTPHSRLAESVQEVVDGGSPMSPAIARRVTQYFQGLPPASGGLGVLSDRERETLDHIARGRTNKEIAQQLDISPHTVGNHVAKIYAKLQVRSRAEATTKYLGR